MERKCLLILVFIMLCLTAFPINLTQTIRGKVIDMESKSPLPGATVVLVGSNPLIGTITDPEGYFCIKGIPVGRHTISASYVGYEESLIPEVMLYSAKELVLTISLMESLNSIDEVTISPDKGKLNNEMSSVSSRSFSVEETKRYPAAIGDLGRMALIFPGVSIGNEDASNEIIIRGNASEGLLWRMEGVEIPNPNHFAVEGSATGYVSMLSTTMLNRSDFLTGAFSADYGNALSGVFDISLRTGNNQRREYGFQIGLLGTDFTAEGPFSRNYKGSYLFNLRYSTMGLLTALGWDSGGDRYLNYSDLSFKLHFPTKKIGNFSIWGMGGPCSAFELPEREPGILPDENGSRAHHRFRGRTMALGISHNIFPSERSYLRTVVSFSQNFSMDDDSLLLEPYDLNHSVLEHRQEMKLSGIRTSILYNNKINNRLTFRTGLNISHLMFNYQDENFLTDDVFLDTSGETQTVQGFMMGKFRLTENLDLFGGIHYMYMVLNGSNALEPRFNLKWRLKPKHELGIGFGKHSRHELISTYMTEVHDSEGRSTNPNKDLELTKALHLVLSYRYHIRKNLHLNSELYYQHLFDVPVMNHQPFGYAPINGIFPDDSLFNNGIARNYGLELSVEKYFSDGFYFLATASIFSSKMKPGNEERWYHTKYNAGHVQNFVGGKEFKLSKDNCHLFGLNAKILWSGGKRGVRYDTIERIVYYNDCFEQQYKDYFRIDAGIYLKINKLRSTHSVSFDVQNLTNRQNIHYTVYDPASGKCIEKYMTGLVPVISYRIEF